MKSNHALAKNLMNLALILLGNAIYALAVTMFILPAGLITGGTTGLALFFFHQFGLPVTAFVSVFNVAMFLLGELVEMGPTERVFATPVDKRTEDYISGRFG